MVWIQLLCVIAYLVCSLYSFSVVNFFNFYSILEKHSFYDENSFTLEHYNTTILKDDENILFAYAFEFLENNDAFLFFSLGELFLVLLITTILIIAAFNHTKRNYFFMSSLISKKFLVTLLFLMSIYFEYIKMLLNADLMSSFIMNSTSHLITTDLFSFIFKEITLVVLFFCLITMFVYTKKQFILPFEYYIILICGILGIFSMVVAGNFLMFFLAIETQALSFYILASLKKNSNASSEAGIKYFVLGAISSGILLLSISVLYNEFGTLSFIDLARLGNSFLFDNTLRSISLLNDNAEHIFSALKIYELDYIYHIITTGNNWDTGSFFQVFVENPKFENTPISFIDFDILEEIDMFLNGPLLNSGPLKIYKIGVFLLCISLFFKLSAAPFHIWAPDVYEGSPLPTTQVFATLSKFIIFAVFIKFFNFFHLLNYNFLTIMHLFKFVIIASILVGTFSALMEQRIKKFFAYSSITHLGYLLFAFSNTHIYAQAAGLSYLVLYLLLNCLTWLALLSYKKNAQIVTYLTDLKMIAYKNYGLALHLLLIICCMAGFPPLVFFFYKLKIFISVISVISNIQTSVNILVFLIMVVGTIISAYYYLNLIKLIFFEKHYKIKIQQRIELEPTSALCFSSLSACLVLTSIFPQTLYDMALLMLYSLF